MKSAWLLNAVLIALVMNGRYERKLVTISF